MTRRLHLIWNDALSAARALTVPKRDVEASDAALETALRDSRLFRAVDLAGAGGRSAWPHSRTRISFLQLIEGCAALSHCQRVRAAGLAAFVAGLTAAFAQTTAAPSPAPLVWVLPATIAAVGLFAALAAGPLARAIADKTS
jgi:hypothetical protein